MTHLVRARQKELGLIPDWAMCCWVDDQNIDVFLVDINSIKDGRIICRRCGRTLGTGMSVTAATGRRKGFGVALVYLDLDEAQLTAEEANRYQEAL